MSNKHDCELPVVGLIVLFILLASACILGVLGGKFL